MSTSKSIASDLSLHKHNHGPDEKDQQSPEENTTFIITKNTRNRFIAKLIILFVLTLALGHIYSKNSAERYQKGRELTRDVFSRI